MAVRIAYINHGRFPTEKAYGNQIAQVCEALDMLKASVTIVCPTFRNAITKSAAEYYGISGDMQEIHLSHFDASRAWYVPGKLAFLFSMRSYGKAIRDHVLKNPYDLLYLRSPLLLRVALETGVRTIIELHDIPRFFKKSFVRLCNRGSLVVALTKPMREVLITMGVDPKKIVTESDGVDLRRFADPIPSAEAKKKWSLPSDIPVIGYVGSLVTRETLSKGVENILEAAVELKKMNHKVCVWIVGGPDVAVKELKGKAEKSGLTDREVVFHGRIEPSLVSSALWACDVCVYPAPASRHRYFMRDTSPLKLFEYMAAGKPMICADIPPVRDIVDEQSALLYKPGNTEMLARQIETVLSDPAAAKKRADNAREIVKNHDWKIRMERILKTASSR